MPTVTKLGDDSTSESEESDSGDSGIEPEQRRVVTCWLAAFLLGVPILVALQHVGVLELLPSSVDSSWLLLQRAVALASVTQFLSWLRQIVPLAGQHGLAPAFSDLSQLTFRERLHRTPSALLIWQSDIALLSACGLGVLASGALALLAAIHWALAAALWLVIFVLHLSVAHAVGPFALNTEEFFCELALLGLLGSLASCDSGVGFGAVPIAAWRWLAFRFHLGAGLAKEFGSPMWADGTAMLHHYYNQPLPNCMSKLFHHMPESLHRVSVKVVFLTQLVCPFAIFAASSWLRLGAFAAFVTLQLFINASGNYGNLGLTTVAICLALLDDDSLALLSGGLIARPSVTSESRTLSVMQLLVAVVFLTHAIVSLVPLLGMTKGYIPIPAKLQSVHGALGGWCVCNRYGPFGAMHDFRHEVICYRMDILRLLFW